MVWWYALINLLYYIILYLDKRYFEMQFNSHIIGGWNQNFNMDPSNFKNPEYKDKSIQQVMKATKKEEEDKVKHGLSVELEKKEVNLLPRESIIKMN